MLNIATFLFNLPDSLAWQNLQGRAHLTRLLSFFTFHARRRLYSVARVRKIEEQFWPLLAALRLASALNAEQ